MVCHDPQAAPAPRHCTCIYIYAHPNLMTRGRLLAEAQVRSSDVSNLPSYLRG